MIIVTITEKMLKLEKSHLPICATGLRRTSYSSKDKRSFLAAVRSAMPPVLAKAFTPWIHPGMKVSTVKPLVPSTTSPEKFFRCRIRACRCTSSNDAPHSTLTFRHSSTWLPSGNLPQPQVRGATARGRRWSQQLNSWHRQHRHCFPRWITLSGKSSNRH